MTAGKKSPAKKATKSTEKSTGINGLIESTRGILTGEPAAKYNQLITDLLDQLITLKDTGKLYAIPGPADSDKERLRIAVTDGELYYRRRGTAYARHVMEIIDDINTEIKGLLNAACNNDAEIMNAEIQAEEEISRNEKEIEYTRRNYIIGYLRPGETTDEAIAEMRTLTKAKTSA